MMSFAVLRDVRFTTATCFGGDIKRLSLSERLAIIDDPEKKLLNKKPKVTFQCHHRNKFELVILTLCKATNDVM